MGDVNLLTVYNVWWDGGGLGVDTWGGMWYDVYNGWMMLGSTMLFDN